MAQAAEKVLEFPSGGIADFYMEDDDIAKMEKEEARKAFGDNGIANFSDVANRMASYGRGGDDTLAHVATGEIVIPLPLIDNNPEMKASIFKHLEELGVEDPEQYVVGSSANSINPETGLREFGWLSKTIRKVTRGVKKAVKSVVKVVKKAAPIIIPFALNALFPGMGAIYQGALGAGIGTLVQGGSLKDAFKSALIGGAIGGAVSGVQGAMGAKAAGKTMTQGAIDNIKGAASLSNLSEAGQQLMTGQFGQSGLDAVRASALDVASVPPTDTFSATVPDPQAQIVDDVSKATTSDASSFTDFMGTPKGPNLNTSGDGLLDTAMDYGRKGMDFLTGGTPTTVDIQTKAAEILGADPTGKMTYDKAFEIAKSELTPGMIRAYGPTTALVGAGLYAAGAFEKPEEEEEEGLGPTGADLLAQYRDKYGNTPVGQRLSEGPYRVATRFPSRFPPIQPVADGGEIFPRRVGGIMPDEGVPGKDSVRAMLMPGEFVMTTDAVKGLGGGNNDQGIKNMYDMMRGLEAKGRAMA
jgi:hypothetical protein